MDIGIILTLLLIAGFLYLIYRAIKIVLKLIKRIFFKKKNQSFSTQAINRYRRTNARFDLLEWIDDDLTDIIVLDTETNGKNPGEYSVLSIGAIRVRWDKNSGFKEISRLERYYYPREPFNEEAIRVNGLNKEAIKRIRGDANYPKYFDEDKEFEQFCEGVHMFAGHNISFDAGFVPIIKKYRRFDTMKANMDIICVYWINKKQEWKYPSLSETANYYQIKYDSDKMHGAIYDAEITLKILKKMFEQASL
ncbi:TPA: 3'-5' exonuclease [Candidatus Poribacteria bacterium]|nr:3'-5' exonuclease [Candidatus Poribacteria bacterium]